MHHMLEIREVILNIFCHLAPSGPSEEDCKSVDSDLAALARTCRTFKEPALNVLWSELNDPSHLIRCLPGAFTRIPVARNTAPDYFTRNRKTYSLTRPLERVERDILRSYARRVWCLCDFEMKLDWRSVKTSMDFTPADPLFLNLRSLRCKFTEETIPLLLLPFPSLIRFDIDLTSDMDPCTLQEPLRSLAKTSPNIKRLDIGGYRRTLAFTKIVSDGICGWSNLQTLDCPQTLLDVRTLEHLSRMPSLGQLTLMLSDAFLDWTAPSNSLSFSALNYLKFHAESLAPISSLLPWTRLPAITCFTVIIDNHSSKLDLSSFMAGIQMVSMGPTIQEFNLNANSGARYTDEPLLELDDLWPCMAFHHLRRMNIDLGWNVGLSDNQLLMMVSAWPRLEELLINTDWGWNTPGITPNGLALLLETCPSLISIGLAIDTRGYTRLPARRYRETLSSSTFERPFSINVIDSAIEEESVAAMAAFFLSIVPHFHFILTSWNRWSVLDLDSRLYHDSWEDVYSQTNELIKKRWFGGG